ncbi:MAG: GNAT family N-acetyltransferase [Planctomycetia bacterium]|nr:GNAT family N-acetyltransferase [Planctomycetia bacterium]
MEFIREVTPQDAAQLQEIYAYYVLNTTFTTEEEAPSVQEMAQRVERITQRFPWLGYESDGKLIGYCYTDTFRTRVAWHRTAEVSVYVHPNCVQQHIGKRMYERLFKILQQQTEIHTLIASITLPNEKSIRLHESFGFIKKAHLPEVGFKFGCYMDVGLWHRPVHLPGRHSFASE